jgi:hypothetical protein
MTSRFLALQPVSFPLSNLAAQGKGFARAKPAIILLSLTRRMAML